VIESTWDSVIVTADVRPEWDYVCFAALPVAGSERVLLALEVDWRDGDEFVPAEAAVAGMTNCLDAGQIAEIVNNAGAQTANPSMEQLRRAVRYYFDNDAFVAL
jgi:hypothetical protein